MGKTKIEWATHTENWLSGCTKVSPACQHCYAETMTARLATMPQAPPRYHDGVVQDRRWTGRIGYDSAALANGLGIVRRAGVRVFANSMSDTFHEHAPATSLTDLAEVIRGLDKSAKGVLMLLTKRPERMLAWQREHFPAGLPAWVWVMTTVEDQERANLRIPYLLQVKAVVRGVSMEPLLGPVDLWSARYPDFNDGGRCGAMSSWRPDGGIHWVIAGGESGPKARPSHPDWFRSLRDQCAAANVPFHFKQWGEWAPLNDGPGGDVDLARYGASPRAAGFFDYSGGWNGPEVPADQRLGMGCEGRMRWNPFRQTMGLVGKHAAGRRLDGVTHDELPKMRVTR